MPVFPTFPDFKMLTLEDRDFVHERLWAFQPQTSELTFVNLYIWRSYYKFQWSVYKDWVFIVSTREGDVYGLPPVGPAPYGEPARALLNWLSGAFPTVSPYIARVGKPAAEELLGMTEFSVTPAREHFDYVYNSHDLGKLAGRKYSKKRNHISQFLRAYAHSYAPLTRELVPSCLDLAEVWCKQRLCNEDISLQHEFCGIHDALTHLDVLQLAGGAILVEGKVQAFALGELLNEQTAVVHIEKANPNFIGIYPMITREFSNQRWSDVAYINREQDLGDLGLRQAKESYYPEFLVEKFSVRPA